MCLQYLRRIKIFSRRQLCAFPVALLILGTCCYSTAATEVLALDDFILIAHRGVVTKALPENSLASLEETIRRGYSHIEVDIRGTRDGHAVCLHDDSLRSAAGLSQLASELTLAELRALVPVEIVPDFATFCARCEGRISLMPDIKSYPPDMEAAFANSVETALVQHGLMKNAYFIGNHDITKRFAEGGRVALRGKLEAMQNKEGFDRQPGDQYFVVGHAVDFDADSVKAFQTLGLKVIVSINIFHYLQLGSWQEIGDRDVARMLDYGVDGLQIDSVYETSFREAFRKTVISSRNDALSISDRETENME